MFPHSEDMADHYLKSLEHLEVVDDARRDLRAAYAGNANAARVAKLHQTINVNLKLADIHATLAEVQAITDAAMRREVAL